jgi:hypothetical protein
MIPTQPGEFFSKEISGLAFNTEIARIEIYFAKREMETELWNVPNDLLQHHFPNLHQLHLESLCRIPDLDGPLTQLLQSIPTHNSCSTLV